MDLKLGDRVLFGKYSGTEVKVDEEDFLVMREDDIDTIRAAWRQQVRESHPDRVIARGLPEEAIKMAEKRLIAVNRAWEEISRDRAA